MSAGRKLVIVESPAKARTIAGYLGDDYEVLAAFIPHGGADVATGHRCPGEKLAIAGLAAAITVLSDPELRILDEGLDVNRRRLPTKPRSGGKVRSAAAPASGGCPFHR